MNINNQRIVALAWKEKKNYCPLATGNSFYLRHLCMEQFVNGAFDAIRHVEFKFPQFLAIYHADVQKQLKSVSEEYANLESEEQIIHSIRSDRR